MKFKVSKTKHYENQLYIQSLASDFELIDVWEYPISFKEFEGDSLFKFRKNAIEPTLKDAFNSSISGSLFKLRGVIGKIFNLDKNVNKLPIPNCTEISLSERMDNEAKTLHNSKLNIDLRTNNFLDFKTVYSFENETAHELSNATEHTIMHYAWIKTANNCHKVQMATYIKHRNKMGHFYIKLISPFRYKVVYPYLFKKYVKYWKEYKKQQ
jgi:hypothetical protein